ncbi:unnamed protein product [Trichobilharzia regenti]|nr:unnamed protein product [Trichobilharzia regenti]
MYVFGLGNSLYTYFNAFGKSVDRLLYKQGAKRLQAITLGDEVDDLENTFLTWRDQLTSSLMDFFNVFNDNKDSLNMQYERIYSLKCKTWGLPVVSRFLNRAYMPEKLPYGTENYVYTALVVNEELYNNSSRSCRHIELDLSGSELSYKTGDHVALFAPNPPDLVKAIAFSLIRHPFPCPCTYRHAFTYFVDITGPPGRNLFSACINTITDHDELKFVQLLISKSEKGKELYSKWILEDHRGFVDVLKDLKSFRPPVDLLLELLNPLKPRLYSISSSALVYPKRIHITASVVNYQTNSGRQFMGLATNWLNSLQLESYRDTLNISIPVTIHSSKFYLPRSRALPIIMIAAGTGLAPFRAFIQERLKLADDKGNLLFDLFLQLSTSIKLVILFFFKKDKLQ